MKAQLFPSQRGPREDLGRWPQGKDPQGEETSGRHFTDGPAQASPLLVGSLGSGQMPAVCLPCLPALAVKAQFPKSQLSTVTQEGVKASGLPIRAFISSWHLFRTASPLDSIPFLSLTCRLQRRNIPEAPSELQDFSWIGRC